MLALAAVRGGTCLAFGRHRQANLSEFKASLIFRANSRTARVTQKTMSGMGGKKKLGLATHADTHL